MGLTFWPWSGKIERSKNPIKYGETIEGSRQCG
jgi:hypothetical protein